MFFTQFSYLLHFYILLRCTTGVLAHFLLRKDVEIKQITAQKQQHLKGLGGLKQLCFH